MTANRLDKTVPVKLSRDGRAMEIFGRQYPFDASDKSGKSKAAASIDAERHGQQVLVALQERLGRPLSTREQISGKPDPVPAPKLEGSLAPIPGPPRSPYAIRAEEVEKRWRTTTPDLKAKKIKRLEELAEADRQWQEKHQTQTVLDAASNSDDTIRAKAHAQERYDELRLRSDVPQEAVDQALASLDAVSKGAISAGQYFQGLEPAPPAPAHGGSLYGDVDAK